MDKRIITADEARGLLVALDAKCPMCGATPTHPIHASTCGVFQVAALASTIIALSEREAATDAWLAEVGHLSLAAAGAELVHLREFGRGRASGDRARFDRCKEDIARVLGLDDVPGWANLVETVRVAAAAEAADLAAKENDNG